MIYMGIDLGYLTETDVVLVDTKNHKNMFMFISFSKELPIDELIYKLYELAVKHNVAGDNVGSPRHPAVEHQLRRMLPTLEQMEKRTKVENT